MNNKMTEQEYQLLKSKTTFFYDDEGIPQVDFQFDDITIMPILKKLEKEITARLIDELKGEQK